MWRPPPLSRLRELLRQDAPAIASERSRPAAVAALLREQSDDLDVLLIRRARREGDPWSGHIALPGGHAHAADADLQATAVRETLEEVGIDLKSCAEPLGRLSDVSPMTGLPLNVRPFCFGLRSSVHFQLSDEVEEAFWVPLGPIAAGHHDSHYQFERAGASLSFPAWRIEDRVVWGMTYRLLSELLERIRPREPRGH